MTSVAAPAPATRRVAMGHVPKRVLLGLLRRGLAVLLASEWAWQRYEAALVRLAHRLPRSRLIRVMWVESVLVRVSRDGALGERVASLSCGLKLSLKVDEYANQGQIYFTGRYEDDTSSIVERLLRPGDVFIDVGANVGFFSLLAASRGAVVHAFEPNAELCQRLLASAAMNGLGARVRVNQAAVADSESPRRLFVSKDGAKRDCASLYPLPHLGDADSMAVETTTLDRYCDRHRLAKVRLVKIDVEGAEALVLRGFRRILTSASRPSAILCELSAFPGGCRPSEVVAELTRSGYRGSLLSSGRILPLRDEDPDRLIPSGASKNALFLDAQADPIPVPGAAADGSLRCAS